MTKKDKIKAYRKAATLIKDYFFIGVACMKVGIEDNIEAQMILLDVPLTIVDNKKGLKVKYTIDKDLRETILLSCAELVRLDFKIE